MSPSISLRFSSYPVERLSITRTRAPLANKAAVRCEPIKPAPPVTRAIPDSDINSASYSHVFKSHFSNVRWIVDIPKISNSRGLHQVANPFHIQGPKLVPLSYENEHVRTGNRLVLICGKFNLRQELTSFFGSNGIVSDHVCPAITQPAN